MRRLGLSRRSVLTVVCGLCPLFAVAPGQAEAAAGRKPNIILILADDVGWGEIGCFGADRFQTPHIDALAESGIRFESCYSMAMCGPSRCTLLTGRYPFRTGLTGNHSANAIEPGGEIMIPTVLEQAGYVTACAGKWGQMSLGPAEWGFDESLAAGNGQYWRGRYLRDGASRELPDGRYLPDMVHEFVADFMERHRDRPFFIYYPMIHVHIPIQPTPDSRPDASPDQLYADNVAYMDSLVGKLVGELDRLGLRDETLLLFVGDNGSIRPPAATPVRGKLLSGHKASMLEGGSRVPMIVSWPGVAAAGAVDRDLIDFSDFFTTFAELAGCEPPPGVTLDGRSFLARIRGAAGAPRDWVYVELDGRSYVRDARWKLTNGGELLDMRDAPFVEHAVRDDEGGGEAAAARSRLQAILDRHPTAPGDGTTRRGKRSPAKRPEAP